MVHGLDNVRLHLYGDELPQKLQDVYGTKKKIPITLSLQVFVS